MLLIKSNTHNPHFNIATEEYLLKNTNEDILFLYRNSDAVIIGKHQLHNLEANIPFCTKNNIPIIRRTSGGGSVFHDLNNLNYCIITSSEKAWVDFESFTSPLIKHLQSLGLSPELRSRSDIRIEGKKISGNASHIFKNRILHHGSILFATDLEKLTEVLKNTPSRYPSKTVKSRRSIVTNIKTHLQEPISIATFEDNFLQSLKESKFINKSTNLNKEALQTIETLANTKYRTPEWNVQYNANYLYKNSFAYKEKIANITLEIKKGICNTAKTSKHLPKDTEQLTRNVPHETSAFINALKDIFSKEEVLSYFF